MGSFNSHIKRSQLAISISILLFFIAISSVVLVFSNYADTTVDTAVNEAQHDLSFLSKIIKKHYMQNDYVGIEQTMEDWIKGNKLDFSINITAANGFPLFVYQQEVQAKHTEQVSTNIYDKDKLLLTILLERDITNVIENANQIRNTFIIIGLFFAFFFALISWTFLNKYAFKPLENEINQRKKIESELTLVNDDLERRVMERTAAFKKLSSVVEQTDDIVIITDSNGIVEYVNPSFEKHTGFLSSEIVNKSINLIKSGLHTNEFYKRLWNEITNGHSFRDVFMNRKKNNEIFYEEKTITPIKNEDGSILYFVATGKDISDRIEAQEKLHHMATHDALTNLPNKLMIMDRLSHAIEQAVRTKSNIAILFLDLDHFKHINDTLGHHIGDVYLKEIASKILKCVRKGDTLGRFGGDEFVILMEGVNLNRDISIVCNKILKIASNTYTIEGHQITNSTSIGVSMYPNDATDSNSLLKSADLAMYKAKANGGNNYQLYTRDMATTSLERMQMQHTLRQSLKNKEFELHYQPQVKMAEGTIDGMEALLRWTNPDFGKVDPEKFIPVLEDMGLISMVGRWVIEQACEFNARLIRKGHSPLKVSVNLSAKQFNDENLVATIKKALTENALDPRLLEIEITESLLLDNSEQVTETLEEIHKLGVSISIDDFGTGFSSLAYLKKYPVDSLKIDRSFVNDIPDHKDDIAIVNAIIALGKNLGLSIIAEGVETEQQLSFFKLNRCDHVQGYYISRAIPENDFEELLEVEKSFI